MIEVLAGLADVVMWARDKCEEWGQEPTPANVAFVAAVFNTPTTVDGVPVDRETWAARTHDVVTGRTRKGKTTQRVTRRGSAFVVGSHDIPHLLAMSGRKLRGGWSTLAVQRATDRLFPDLPKLLGTDVMSWEQVIPGDRSTAAPGNAGESGGRVTWPTRLTIPRPSRRASDPVPTATALLAGHDDSERLWHGHRCVVRQPAKRTRVARKARTVGAYRADSIDQALATLATLDVERGQRVTFTGADWDLAVTRSQTAKPRPFRATLKRDGATTVPIENAVSVRSLADRIARKLPTA